MALWVDAVFEMTFCLLLMDHPLPSIVTLGKLFDCSKNQFSPLQSGDNSCASSTEMRVFSEMMIDKCYFLKLY